MMTGWTLDGYRESALLAPSSRLVGKRKLGTLLGTHGLIQKDLKYIVFFFFFLLSLKVLRAQTTTSMLLVPPFPAGY